MKLVNLCGHPIAFLTESNHVFAQVAPSGAVARVDKVSAPEGEIVLYGNKTFPIERREFGSISHLPEPQEDTLYIVSHLVALAAKEQGRQDVVFPRLVKRQRKKGKGEMKGAWETPIIGCQALMRP